MSKLLILVEHDVHVLMVGLDAEEEVSEMLVSKGVIQVQAKRPVTKISVQGTNYLITTDNHKHRQSMMKNSNNNDNMKILAAQINNLCKKKKTKEIQERWQTGVC